MSYDYKLVLAYSFYALQDN